MNPRRSPRESQLEQVVLIALVALCLSLMGLLPLGAPSPGNAAVVGASTLPFRSR